MDRRGIQQDHPSALGLTCVIVGTLLTVINHGDQLLGGEFDSTMACQIGLTFLVPFVVATVSSTMAIRSHADHDPHGPAIAASRLAGQTGSLDGPEHTEP